MMGFVPFIPSAEAWATFRDRPQTPAALERVPDPVDGLDVYRWFGEEAGDREPRRPRSPAGAGSVALPRIED